MKVRVCPKCNKHNLDSVKKCSNCGTRLPIYTLTDVDNAQISEESEQAYIQKADVEELPSTTTPAIASPTKIRVCPKCNRHNTENAWSCVECGTTLSIESLVYLDSLETNGKQLPNEPLEIHSSVSHSSQPDVRPMKEIDQTLSQSVFCSNCGEKLSIDANFCWKCGEKLQSKTSSASPATEQHPKTIQQSSQSFLTCPSCGHEDMVQNIDTLVQGNTITTRFYGNSSGKGRVQGSSTEFTYGSSSSGSSTTRSTLAGKLDFPSKTSPSMAAANLYGLIMWLGIPILSIMIARGSGEVCVSFGIACEVLLIIIAGFRKKTVNEQEKKWIAAQAYWKQLYYCSREGTVFDPQTKRKISLSDINRVKWRDFLFQRT